MRLRFPWLDDTYVSGWARTVQAGAGKDRGALVLPEVGDEVLVVFEQGDFRRPYVLGGLYNGMDQPSPQGIPAVDGGKGRSTDAPSSPAGVIGSTSSTRTARPRASPSPAATARSA